MASDVRTQPVETTLHKYDRRRSAYTISGESITFRFPASYYFWVANQKGGPQSRITLDVDRTDLSAIRPSLVELRRPERFIASQAEIASLERRRIHIHVLSPLVTYDLTLFEIKNGELRPIGEAYCGLDMFVESNTRQRDASIARSPSMPRYPFSTASTFVSVRRIDNDKFANDFDFKATCNPTTRLQFCNVSAYFENWPIEFKIEKDKLCDWRQEAERIRDLLARHVVRRTTPAPVR